MGLSLVHSRALIGLEARPVQVEVHLANGLPSFTFVACQLDSYQANLMPGASETRKAPSGAFLPLRGCTVIFRTPSDQRTGVRGARLIKTSPVT
jgi:hypothetical protein